MAIVDKIIGKITKSLLWMLLFSKKVLNKNPNPKEAIDKKI